MRSRYNIAFDSMINEAGAVGPAFANWGWMLVDDDGHFSAGLMKKLSETPSSDSLKEECLSLSNKLLCHAQRAKRERAHGLGKKLTKKRRA